MRNILSNIFGGKLPFEYQVPSKGGWHFNGMLQNAALASVDNMTDDSVRYGRKENVQQTVNTFVYDTKINNAVISLTGLDL